MSALRDPSGGVLSAAVRLNYGGPGPTVLGFDIRPDRAIPGSCRHAGIASGIYDPWGTRSPPRQVGALILDASVLMGLLDREDPHHNRAVDEVEGANGAERELMAPASRL
jgi:hypothetical protein